MSLNDSLAPGLGDWDGAVERFEAGGLHPRQVHQPALFLIELTFYCISFSMLQPPHFPQPLPSRTALRATLRIIRERQALRQRPITSPNIFVLCFRA